MNENTDALPNLFTLLLATRDTKLYANERLVLTALLLRCNTREHGWRCFPSYATLARDTDLSERTVQRVMSVLTDSDLVRIERRANKTNWFHIEYAELLDWAEEVRKQRAEQEKKAAAKNCKAPTRSKMNIRDRKGFDEGTSERDWSEYSE